MTGKILIYRDQENRPRNVINREPMYSNNKDFQEANSFSKKNTVNEQQQSPVDSCNTTNDGVATDSLSGTTITVSSSSRSKTAKPNCFR